MPFALPGRGVIRELDHLGASFPSTRSRPGSGLCCWLPPARDRRRSCLLSAKPALVVAPAARGPPGRAGHMSSVAYRSTAISQRPEGGERGRRPTAGISSYRCSTRSRRSTRSSYRCGDSDDRGSWPSRISTLSRATRRRARLVSWGSTNQTSAAGLLDASISLSTLFVSSCSILDRRLDRPRRSRDEPVIPYLSRPPRATLDEYRSKYPPMLQELSQVLLVQPPSSRTYARLYVREHRLLLVAELVCSCDTIAVAGFAVVAVLYYHLGSRRPVSISANLASYNLTPVYIYFTFSYSH